MHFVFKSIYIIHEAGNPGSPATPPALRAGKVPEQFTLTNYTCLPVKRTQFMNDII
jgi:hypothetical protein